jgi:hypothetical protein
MRRALADYAPSPPDLRRRLSLSYSKPLPFSWIGGHGTVPYEQKTQQLSGSGLSLSPQPLQS